MNSRAWLRGRGRRARRARFQNLHPLEGAGADSLRGKEAVRRFGVGEGKRVLVGKFRSSHRAYGGENGDAWAIKKRGRKRSTHALCTLSPGAPPEAASLNARNLRGGAAILFQAP